MKLPSWVSDKFGGTDLSSRLVGGAVWSFWAAAVTNGASFIAMLVVARILGKEAFGRVVILQSTIGMVGVIAGFGIGAVATRYVAELKLRDAPRLRRILALTRQLSVCLGITAMVGVFMLADVIAHRFLSAPELSLPIAICGVTVLFSTIDGYQKSVLVGLEAMRAFAMVSLGTAAVGIPFLVLGASLHGVEGVAWAIAGNSLLAAILSAKAMKTCLALASLDQLVTGVWQEWRIIRDFGLPSVLSALMISPSHWIAHAELSNTKAGFEELAVLGVAMQWFNLVLFVPSVFGRVTLPVITDTLAQGKPEQARRVVQAAIMFNTLLAVVLAAIFGVLSPQIMMVYGERFESGWPVLAIALFIAIFVAAAMPVGQLLAARNRMWIGAAMNLGWSIVYVVGAHYMSRLGAFGVIAAMGIAYAVHSIWVSWYAIGSLRRISSSS